MQENANVNTLIVAENVNGGSAPAGVLRARSTPRRSTSRPTATVAASPASVRLWAAGPSFCRSMATGSHRHLRQQPADPRHQQQQRARDHPPGTSFYRGHPPRRLRLRGGLRSAVDRRAGGAHVRRSTCRPSARRGSPRTVARSWIRPRPPGIVEELEKAHIYIAQLNERLNDKEAEVERLQGVETEVALRASGADRGGAGCCHRCHRRHRRSLTPVRPQRQAAPRDPLSGGGLFVDLTPPPTRRPGGAPRGRPPPGPSPGPDPRRSTGR